MSKTSDISTMWNTIKSSQKIDPTLIDNIQKVVLEDSNSDKAPEKKNKVRNSKRLASRRPASGIFGNPLRNVSDSLIILYNKTKKFKKHISPVYESLGYSKKLKKFTKWPILLKDFVNNLFQEITINNESTGKSVKVELELKETLQPEKKSTRSKGSKQEPKTSIKQEAVSSQSALSMGNSQKSGEKVVVTNPNSCEEPLGLGKQEVDGDSFVKENQVGSPIRNLHSPSTNKINQINNSKEEEKHYSSDREMEDMHNSCDVDMECQENLMDSEINNSPTVRTEQSPKNEPRFITTAEKESRPTMLTEMKKEGNTSMS